MEFMTEIFTQLQPAILEIVSLIIGVALLYLGNIIRRKTGLDIEARHRDALHSALMSGVRAALKGGAGAGRSAVIESAVAYARNIGAPDAVKHFALNSGQLKLLAERHVDEAQAP